MPRSLKKLCKNKKAGVLHLEWHQLQYFKAVAELQHMTKAAQVLSLSQPALSRSIAKLEEELGVPLFERKGKTLRLNRYGKLFLKSVDRATQAIEEGKQLILDQANPDYGTVTLAFLHSLGNHMVPELLRNFRARYPHIQFKLYQNATSKLLEQLEEGEIDLCLSSPVLTAENVVWSSLFKEDLYIVVPKNHRLAQRSEVHLKEIALDPLITFKKDYGLRILVDSLFKEVNVNPQITFEGEEIMTVAGLVEACLGVAVIPKIDGLNTANLCFLPITAPQSQRVIGMAHLKNHYLSPAARRFRDFVLESFIET